MSVSLHAGRGGQGGYALLALLATSAILLAGLALSLPRMAMQALRVKEERLIERGEQYRRAIELYYREHGKYPPELDDLEDTDGVRYLRRRYKEPMGTTGEWRIIHMGTDGRFEDSLLHDLGEPEGTGPRALFGDSAGGPAGTMIAERQGMDDRAGPGPPGYPDPGARHGATGVRQRGAAAGRTAIGGAGPRHTAGLHAGFRVQRRPGRRPAAGRDRGGWPSASRRPDAVRPWARRQRRSQAKSPFRDGQPTGRLWPAARRTSGPEPGLPATG